MISLNRMLANVREIDNDELDLISGAGYTTYCQVRNETCYGGGSCGMSEWYTISDDSAA